MLLQRLVDYADRIGLPPTLYNLTPIPTIIMLNSERPDQPFVQPTATDTEKRGTRRLAPQVTRAVAIKPLLLADNAEYTLGFGRDESKPERVRACHAAYMDILTRCVTETREPTVQAIRDFLDRPPEDLAALLTLPEGFDRGGLITFQVDGISPIDLPSVQDFWAREHDPAAREGGGQVMQCLVCGQERPVLDRLQGKVKGVPGGQTAGTSIISANAEAFESYSLKASLIAPTCATCGEKFTKALNELIANKQHRMFLGGAVFVYWTREPADDFPLWEYVEQPTEKTVSMLLASAKTGQRVAPLDDRAFYALALSGSGGRAVVRDWMDTTVRAVQGNLAAWFAGQRIAGGQNTPFEPLKLFSLAAATVREPKDLTPQTARTLLHAALTGTPLPWNMLAQVIRRTRVEHGVTRPQAALIKLVLASHGKIEGDTLDALNPDYDHPAYLCGRLLAVLENLQAAAIPGIKAGVGDRYFGMAQTAPALVFPRLIALAKSHLNKIERDNVGAYLRISDQLDALMTHLPAKYPGTLTLEEQGRFGLGYFHQVAANRAGAKEGAERRRLRQAEGRASMAEADEGIDNERPR